MRKPARKQPVIDTIVATLGNEVRASLRSYFSPLRTIIREISRSAPADGKPRYVIRGTKIPTRRASRDA